MTRDGEIPAFSLRASALSAVKFLSLVMFLLATWACEAKRDDVPPVADAGTVEGRVIPAQAGVFVRMAGTDLATVTDEEGRYTLHLVPEGEQSVEAEIRDQEGTILAGRRTVYPSAGRVVQVEDLNLTATGALRGKATLEDRDGHEGIRILLEGTTHLTQTESDGSYGMEGVPAGSYTVLFLYPGFEVGRWEGVEVTEGAILDLEPAILKPEPDAASRILYGSIVGAVLNRDGNPLAGAIASTVPSSSLSVTGADGYFAIHGLFPITYVLEVEKEGYVARTSYVPVLAGSRETADVTLTRRGGSDGTSHPAFTNRPPELILNCPDGVVRGTAVEIFVKASDPDGDPVGFSALRVVGGGGLIAPASGGRMVVRSSVTDGMLSSEAECTILARRDDTGLNSCPSVAVSGPGMAAPGEIVLLTAAANDSDGDTVSIQWNAGEGHLNRTIGNVTAWTAPASVGRHTLSACATDGLCSPRSCGNLEMEVRLTDMEDPPPTCRITGPTTTQIHSTLTLTASVQGGSAPGDQPGQDGPENLAGGASDPDGEAVTVTWTASGGTLSKPDGPSIAWTPTDGIGAYAVTCTARDESGREGRGQIGIVVTDPPRSGTCPLITGRGPTAVSVGKRAILDFLVSDANDPARDLVGGCDTPAGYYTVSNVFTTGAANFEWTAPEAPGAFTFNCFTSNGLCARSFAHTVTVLPGDLPSIRVRCEKQALQPGQSTECEASASEEADFSWSASGGTLSSTTGTEVTWTAPSCGRCTHAVTVAGTAANGRLNVAVETIQIVAANKAPHVALNGPTEVDTGRSVDITASVSDEDDGPAALFCTWGATGGLLDAVEGCSSRKWSAPKTEGDYTISVAASDSDRSSTASMKISVRAAGGNLRPHGSIDGASSVDAGGAVDLACKRTDPEGAAVTYTWSSASGVFASGSSSRTRWTAPNTAGDVTVSCTIQDDVTPEHDVKVQHVVHVTAIPAGIAYGCDADTIALYHLDETSGSTAFDKCGQGRPAPGAIGKCQDGTSILRGGCGARHGTVQGAELDHEGQVGRAFFFDGKDDFVKVADGPDPGADSRFTLEAWFKLKCDCPTTGYALAGKGAAGADSFGLEITSDHRVRFALTPSDGGSRATVTSTRSVNDLVWHHAAASYDGRAMKLYLDGVLEATSNVQRTIGSREHPFLVGAADTDENGEADAMHFLGWIDEVRISGDVREPVSFGVARQSRALRWAKGTGNPFLTASALWETPSVSYPSVVKVSSKYLLYYQGGGAASWNIGIATSDDAVTWTALAVPILAIGSSGAWDAGAVERPAVYYDGSEYWLYYGGKSAFTDKSNKLGLAKATNGLEFTKHASNPIMSQGGEGAWDEIAAFPGSIVREAGQFRMYYTGFYASDTARGRLGLATSSDGVTWARDSSNPLLEPGDTGRFDDSSAQHPRVIKVGSTWFLFYEGVKKSGAIAIGVATSLDGFTWTKSDSNPVLSADQSWETLSRLEGASPLLDDDDRLILTYGGPTLTGSRIGVAYEIPERFIPAGPFLMGSDANEGSESERPEHVVRLSPYWIDTFEVTNAAYKACVDTGPCSDPSGGTNSATRANYFSSAGFSNHPVIRVKWSQADQYCRWIGKRLPTEAEWEKAARGPYPEERVYPWGDAEVSCWPANMTGCVGDTEVVMARPGGTSFFGARSLSGNVAEWVSDWFGAGFYAIGASRDPAGPASGSQRIVRGGSWKDADAKNNLRVSYRGVVSDPDAFTSDDVGFRCARDP